jgi:hypothetical protein
MPETCKLRVGKIEGDACTSQQSVTGQLKLYTGGRCLESLQGRVETGWTKVVGLLIEVIRGERVMFFPTMC